MPIRNCMRKSAGISATVAPGSRCIAKAAVIAPAAVSRQTLPSPRPCLRPGLRSRRCGPLGSKQMLPQARSLPSVDKQRELAPTEQLSEVSVEADEVLAPLRDGCDQPCIGQIIAAELLVQAELSKSLPLWAELGE